MITRFCVVRFECPYCAMAKKAINHINSHLPDDKQIRILDNYEWEKFLVKSHPILETLPEDFDGYPYIFIDGIVIESAETDLLIISIAEILKEDLLTPINLSLNNEYNIHD